MGRDGRLEAVAMPRRDRPVQVAAVSHHPRLVECHPQLDPIVEPAEHNCSVVGEPARAVRVEPAAPIVQRRGEVPVKQGERGLDAVFQECIDQPVIEIQTAGIDRAASLRQDALHDVLKRYACSPSWRMTRHRRRSAGSGRRRGHRCRRCRPGPACARSAARCSAPRRRPGRAFDLVRRRCGAPENAREIRRCHVLFATYRPIYCSTTTIAGSSSIRSSRFCQCASLPLIRVCRAIFLGPREHEPTRRNARSGRHAEDGVRAPRP